MLVFYGNHGYVNWAIYNRKNLYSNGFGYIWEAQNVDNEALILSKYLLRIKYQYLQTWTDLCNNNNKLKKIYIYIIPSFSLEK